MVQLPSAAATDSSLPVTAWSVILRIPLDSWVSLAGSCSAAAAVASGSDAAGAVAVLGKFGGAELPAVSMLAGLVVVLSCSSSAYVV